MLYFDIGAETETGERGGIGQTRVLGEESGQETGTDSPGFNGEEASGMVR